MPQCDWCMEQADELNTVNDTESVCDDCLEEAIECERCGAKTIDGYMGYCDPCAGDMFGKR